MYLDKNGFPAKATPNHPTFTDADETSVCFTEDGGAQVWWNVLKRDGSKYHLERQDNSNIIVEFEYVAPKAQKEVKDEPKEIKEPEVAKSRAAKPAKTKKPRAVSKKKSK